VYFSQCNVVTVIGRCNLPHAFLAAAELFRPISSVLPTKLPRLPSPLIPASKKRSPCAPLSSCQRPPPSPCFCLRHIPELAGHRSFSQPGEDRFSPFTPFFQFLVPPLYRLSRRDGNSSPPAFSAPVPFKPVIVAYQHRFFSSTLPCDSALPFPKDSATEGLFQDTLCLTVRTGSPLHFRVTDPLQAAFFPLGLSCERLRLSFSFEDFQARVFSFSHATQAIV